MGECNEQLKQVGPETFDTGSLFSEADDVFDTDPSSHGRHDLHGRKRAELRHALLSKSPLAAALLSNAFTPEERDLLDTYIWNSIDMSFELFCKIGEYGEALTRVRAFVDRFLGLHRDSSSLGLPNAEKLHGCTVDDLCREKRQLLAWARGQLEQTAKRPL